MSKDLDLGEVDAANEGDPGRIPPALSDGRSADSGYSQPDILHLAELVPIVRERLFIAPEFPDDALLASLKAIASRTGERERAEAAFASNLGQHIGQGTSARGHSDMQAALSTLLSLLPPPRS